MRGRARVVLAAGVTTVALFAAACSGGSGESPGTESTGGQAGGEIVING